MLQLQHCQLQVQILYCGMVQTQRVEFRVQLLQRQVQLRQELQLIMSVRKVLIIAKVHGLRLPLLFMIIQLLQPLYQQIIVKMQQQQHFRQL